MNRTAIGLAIGAGYVLGRTKKMKLAIAAGSMIAGKRLNLSPGAVTELLTRQLKDNPQFKEIGDELRQDLRGVGKAASGALVERQISALADRLHDRTADVRGRLSGAVPDTGGGAEEEQEEEPAGAEDTGRDTGDGNDDEAGRDKDKAPRGRGRSRSDEDESKGNDEEERPARRKPAARSSAAKKTAGRASAAKKAPARKTASGAARTARSGGRKGGDDR